MKNKVKICFGFLINWQQMLTNMAQTSIHASADIYMLTIFQEPTWNLNTPKRTQNESSHIEILYHLQHPQYLESFVS